MVRWVIGDGDGNVRPMLELEGMGGQKTQNPKPEPKLEKPEPEKP